MSLQQSIIAFLLLAASGCQAQTSRLSVSVSNEGRMQPWLVGMAAMVGFLFIVFAILIIKRLMRKNRDEEESLCETSCPKEAAEGTEMKQTNL